jgi:hypothetical protein
MGDADVPVTIDDEAPQILPVAACIANTLQKALAIDKGVFFGIFEVAGDHLPAVTASPVPVAFPNQDLSGLVADDHVAIVPRIDDGPIGDNVPVWEPHLLHENL